MVIEKVRPWLSSREDFIADVLSAAGIRSATRLFAHERPGNQDSGRTIDDQQELTAGTWLNQLLTGHDFVWSETRNDSGEAFSYDKVGPSTLGHRADGIILELRSVAEQGRFSASPDQWRATAEKYGRLARLNEPTTALTDLNLLDEMPLPLRAVT